MNNLSKQLKGFKNVQFAVYLHKRSNYETEIISYMQQEIMLLISQTYFLKCFHTHTISYMIIIVWKYKGQIFQYLKRQLYSFNNSSWKIGEREFFLLNFYSPPCLLVLLIRNIILPMVQLTYFTLKAPKPFKWPKCSIYYRLSTEKIFNLNYFYWNFFFQSQSSISNLNLWWIYA